MYRFNLPAYRRQPLLLIYLGFRMIWDTLRKDRASEIKALSFNVFGRTI